MPFVLRACCGGMCWPRERPATHAAAGAAARGVRGDWGIVSHALERWHERVRGGGLIRCAGRPRKWSCGAVPPQERWHEGGWFLFFLWRLLRCRRGILSHATEWMARGGWFLFFEGGALLRIIFQCPPSPENPPLSPVPPAESGWAFCAHWPPKDARW